VINNFRNRIMNVSLSMNQKMWLAYNFTNLVGYDDSNQTLFWRMLFFYTRRRFLEETGGLVSPNNFAWRGPKDKCPLPIIKLL